MMRLFLMSFVVLASLAFGSDAAFGDVRRLEVGPFAGIDASSGVRVEAVVGSAHSVEAEGSAAALDRLQVEVRDGVLHVFRKNQWLGSPGRVTVRVSAPQLNRFEASSGGDVRASGLAGQDVTAAVSSGGVLRLSGGCGALRASASSGGVFEGENLRCFSLEASASSGGQLQAYASEKVDAEASSGGSVRVGGAPGQVNRASSSGGSVRVCA